MANEVLWVHPLHLLISFLLACSATWQLRKCHGSLAQTRVTLEDMLGEVSRGRVNQVAQAQQHSILFRYVLNKYEIISFYITMDNNYIETRNISATV